MRIESQIAGRIAGAFVIVLWSGLVGALAGFGASYVYPAQYRSTGRIFVSPGQEGELNPLQRAASMAVGAKSATTLSTAILVADLYHGERDSTSLNELVNRLTFTTSVKDNGNGGAIVDLSMTYADREKVQRALESVIRHVVADDRLGALSSDARNASTPVRIRGLDPGTGVLAGFAGGLLLHAIFTQFQLAGYRNRAQA